MNKPSYRLIQSFLVIGLASYLSALLTDGSLANYIHHRFFYLTAIAISILCSLGVIGFFSTLTEYVQKAVDSPIKKILLSAVIISPVILTSSHLITSETMAIILSLLCLLILLALNFRNMAKTLHEYEEKAIISLLFITFPLVLGSMVPFKPLSASALKTKGFNLASVSPASEQGNQHTIDPEKRNIMDWVKLINKEKDNPGILGQKADVIGFAYHDSRLAENHFMVGRFVITCCVADASAIGMVVEWTGGKNVVDNQWIRVKGKVSSTVLDGRIVPFIQAESVEETSEPTQPYLYP